jgi:CheY-like chemotaxis protein
MSVSPDRPQATAVTHRVLVVDDGASTADMLALFFRLEGFETHTAYDGAQALELARTIRPTVVFMDIGMPGMDGYEAARRMRQLPGCENAVLVALTGWGHESDRRRALEAGFHHHLAKPVEPGMLRGFLAGLRITPQE